MSSDSTGEIWVLQKADVTALGGPGGTSSGGGTLVTSTNAANLAARSGRSHPGGESLLLAITAAAFSLVWGALLVAA